MQKEKRKVVTAVQTKMLVLSALKARGLLGRYKLLEGTYSVIFGTEDGGIKFLRNFRNYLQVYTALLSTRLTFAAYSVGGPQLRDLTAMQFISRLARDRADTLQSPLLNRIKQLKREITVPCGTEADISEPVTNGRVQLPACRGNRWTTEPAPAQDTWGCGRARVTCDCGRALVTCGCGRALVTWGCGRALVTWGCGRALVTWGCGRALVTWGCGRALVTCGCGRALVTFDCGRALVTWGCGRALVTN
jgi:hypothetical protein